MSSGSGLVLHHSNIAATSSVTSEILHFFRKRVLSASYRSVYEWCAACAIVQGTRSPTTDFKESR
jgi:hypothetical protein